MRPGGPRTGPWYSREASSSSQSSHPRPVRERNWNHIDSESDESGRTFQLLFVTLVLHASDFYTKTVRGWVFEESFQLDHWIIGH